MGLESQDICQAKPRTSDEMAGRQPEHRVLWFCDRLLISTIALVFLIDQLSKYLVKANLRLYESWPSEGIVRLTYGANTGTAFGLFPNQTFVLIVASLAAIAFLYYFYKTHALDSRLLRLSIGLQLGGAFGNLFDRLRTGAVVDFLDVGWWPIFNIADSCVVIGIIILASAVILGEGAQPERERGGNRVGLEE